MSKFACIMRLAHNIAVFMRKRSVRENTLCGSWAIYQFYKLYGNGEMSQFCLRVFRKKLLYSVGSQRKHLNCHALSKLEMSRYFEKLMCRSSFLYFFSDANGPVKSLCYFQVDTELRFNISVTSAPLNLSVALPSWVSPVLGSV